MAIKKYSVFGAGNPLMDIIASRGYDFIAEFTDKPGTMNMVPPEVRERLVKKLADTRLIPGGSCANTLKGIAWLSKSNPDFAKPVFFGSIGQDDLGIEYRNLMTSVYGVDARLAEKPGEATGTSVIIVTPDFERTMFTNLGASQKITSADVDFSLIPQSQIFHCTAYMWGGEDQREIILRGAETAKKNKLTLSFDLADPFVVKPLRQTFLSWIPSFVDILFGNREEMAMMLGEDSLPDEELARKAGKLAPTVVMKAGAKGCYIVNSGRAELVEGRKVKPVDTIGAGDSFAAGFLYGSLARKGLRECARYANTVAAGIVSVVGCDFLSLQPMDLENS